MTKDLPLPNGYFAIVDDEDFERVSEHFWYIQVRSTGVIAGIRNNKYGSLPLFIMQLEDKEKIVIHKNGDKFDNRRENLVIVPRNKAYLTFKAARGSSSKYKGVSYAKDRNKWRARIGVNGKYQTLGHFENEDDAAKAYNEAAIRLFGEHAYQNVIGENNQFETIQLNHSVARMRNKTKYRGVYVSKLGKYIARIYMNDESIYLGSYDTAEDAAKAYDAVAIKQYGSRAVLNFPMKE